MSLQSILGGVNLPLRIPGYGAALAKDPLFWYRGEQASTSSWVARVGTDLPEAHGTSAGTVGRDQSPLGAKDTSVLFNTDMRYVAANAASYDFTTDDFAFLAVVYQINEATYRVVFGKSAFAAGNEQGYWLRINNDHTISFRWSAAGGTGATATGAALSGGDLDAWHMIAGFVDQDENSASSLRLYLDGVYYASAILNLGATSITCTSKFSIGAQGAANSSSPFHGDIAMVAGWYAGQGWWPGGTANDVIWDHIAAHWYDRWVNGSLVFI